MGGLSARFPLPSLPGECFFRAPNARKGAISWRYTQPRLCGGTILRVTGTISWRWWRRQRRVRTGPSRPTTWVNSHTRARTHARTHARTRAHAHARARTHTLKASRGPRSKRESARVPRVFSYDVFCRIAAVRGGSFRPPSSPARASQCPPYIVGYIASHHRVSLRYTVSHSISPRKIRRCIRRHAASGASVLVYARVNIFV